MIEVSRKSGGFALFSRGEQAIGRYECELLMTLRNENPDMEPDARDVFLEKLGDLLTKIDVQGYRQKVTIGDFTFATGR